MQNLKVFQSMWAMERRSSRVPELTKAESVYQIAAAGFDGVSAHWTDGGYVAALHSMLKDQGLQAEVTFPPFSTAD